MTTRFGSVRRVSRRELVGCRELDYAVRWIFLGKAGQKYGDLFLSLAINLYISFRCFFFFNLAVYSVLARLECSIPRAGVG